MENIRLIACDLDGTLLLDGAQSLRPETCGLIAALLERGVQFFAASGRQYPEPYMKISAFERGGVRDEAYWRERFSDRCAVVTGGNDRLDRMPKGVNKGAALARILRALDIAPEACMAIGETTTLKCSSSPDTPSPSRAPDPLSGPSRAVRRTPWSICRNGSSRPFAVICFSMTGGAAQFASVNRVAPLSCSPHRLVS